MVSIHLEKSIEKLCEKERRLLSGKTANAIFHAHLVAPLGHQLSVTMPNRLCLVLAVSRWPRQIADGEKVLETAMKDHLRVCVVGKENEDRECRTCGT